MNAAKQQRRKWLCILFGKMFPSLFTNLSFIQNDIQLYQPLQISLKSAAYLLLIA